MPQTEAVVLGGGNSIAHVLNEKGSEKLISYQTTQSEAGGQGLLNANIEIILEKVYIGCYI